MLQALYRRLCIDVAGLHNPVEQWRVGGGRLHQRRRRRIAPPVEVLPRRHRGFETAVRNPVARDAFRFGLYTGMRRAEVFRLRWTQVDLGALTLRVEETKTGEPLEFPRFSRTGSSRHPEAQSTRCSEALKTRAANDPVEADDAGNGRGLEWSRTADRRVPDPCYRPPPR